MHACSQSNIRVFLNRHCSHGKGIVRWEKIKDELRRQIGMFELEEILSPVEVTNQVSNAVELGTRIFIAAGGDGTVNLLLNAIMKLDSHHDIILGAVGLGSSNDFHKPFRKEAFFNRTPVKIDFKNASPCDVIRIDYQSTDRRWCTRFGLLNASIGVTAQANALFNSGPKFIRMLQRVSVDCAIIAVALQTIFTYRNILCQLTVDGREHRVPITNLGVIKNPHFTGSLCYDTPIEPDNGKLGINLCFGMSLFEKIRTFVALANHHFQGRPKTRSWITLRFSVKSKRPFALEFDGEIVQAIRTEFSVVPKAVAVCR